MNIIVLYNLSTTLKRGNKEDLICEKEITIIAPLVRDVLQSKGHSAELMESTPDLFDKLSAIKGKVDIVFNLAEGFGGSNSSEVFNIAILETLEIPFTGASLRNFIFTRDKGKMNLILSTYGVPTPRRQVFYPEQDVVAVDLRFPLIVKPMYEDASIGITYDSVVSGIEELSKRVKYVAQLYRQPVLVEEFIQGREISVGCIGNRSDIKIFPPLEFVFGENIPPYQRIRSYEYKWGGGKEGMEKAILSDELVRLFQEYTRIAFLMTDCCDYARMDYRLSDDGKIFLLETNCNPGIGPNSHGLNNTLTMMASFLGYSFEYLVEQILLIAQKRYGL
ncbi:MAG: D-alanine--D-alanine ligase [bacterium]